MEAASENSIILQHPTLLNENTAKWISSLSTCTRLSIRVTALISEIIMESAKYSTSVSIQLSRRAIISALASAKNYHLSPINDKIKEITDDQLIKSLERCTQLGVYIVHQSFTLVELFAMSSFHFFSNTFKSGLWLAEESVRIFDGLFGSTETSRALASIVMLVQREIYEDDEFMAGKMKNSGLISALTKALTAFACLQNVTNKRFNRELQLICLYQGHIPLKNLLESKKQPKLLTDGNTMIKSNSETNIGVVDNKEVKVNSPINLNKSNVFDGTVLSSINPKTIERTKGRTRRSKSISYISKELRTFSTNGFSSGMVELLDQSDNTLNNTFNYIGEKVIVESSSSPIILNSIQTLHNIKSSIKEDNSNLFIPTPENLLSLINRFMRYSSAAYGSHFMRILGIGTWEETEDSKSSSIHINHYAFSRHTSTPIESILFSSYDSVNSTFTSQGNLLSPAKLHPLVHYVTVDHAINAIVLTCRGTLGISDALTDLTCDYTPLKLNDNIYKAHSGMLNSALVMADEKSEVHAIIEKALKQYPGYGLVLCGHSLGGGVVSLLAALWSEKTFNSDSKPMFQTSKESKLPPGRYIHCFTYGVPPTLTLDGSNYCKGLVTSVVNQDDIVPCLSLGILRDFKNITTSLMNEENLPQLILQRTLGLNTKLLTNNPQPDKYNDLSDEHLDTWFYSLIKTMRADMQSEKLLPPGNVYIINYQTVVAESNQLNNPYIHYKANTSSFRSNSTPTNFKIKQKVTSSNPMSCLKITISQCLDVRQRFSEITFSKSMFGDHSPRSYEDNLDALNKALNGNF